MSHSYVNNLMHCTFSTKERYPFIDAALESDLWPYVVGIAGANRMKALAIGGTADHLHASLSSMMSFAKAAQLIKGGPQNGCMILFQGTRSLNDRKVTEHLASALHRHRKPLHISKVKRNIIG